MMNENQLAIEDKHTASVQLHSLLKGSAFWPQLIGMKDVLTESEKETLAKDTATLF